MKLGALSATDYTTWSNNDLDNAYAVAFAAKDMPTYTAIGVEIVDRLASPTSFALSFFGDKLFPQWQAIQASGATTSGFIPTDAAQQAVVTSSGNLITKAESMLTSGVWLFGAAGLLILFLRYGKK